MLPPNSVTASTLITEFPMGISHVQFLSGGDSTGLPEQYGILTTYRHSETVNGLNYQEFKGNNNYNKYIRYVKSDGTWNDWRKFVTEEA